MQRRLSTAFVALCALASIASAQDVAPPAAPGVEDAVRALADPKRRDDAIALLGDQKADALAAIVAVAASRPADDALWSGLELALGRWEGSSDADGLSRRRVSWPEAARSRLDGLVHRLRVRERLAPLPDLGRSPPEVAAAVRGVLLSYASRSSYRTPNPDVAALAKLGRDAIPALISMLRDPELSDFAYDTTGAALALLAEERDIPLLRRLLEGGCPQAARCLSNLRSDAALDALVAAVERDVADDRFFRMLAEQDRGPRAALAVAGWIERHPKDFTVGSAAEVVVGARCAAAVPGLERALDVQDEESIRAEIALALASLGVARGIDALVDLVEAGHDPWARNAAGDALNDIVGRRVLVADIGGPGRTWSGNFDEAAVTFRTWWNTNGDKLSFDTATRRWRLPGERRREIPAGSTETAEKVRALLASFEGEHSYSPFNAEVREIVELGRDAVPELLRQIGEAAETRRASYAKRHAATDALAELATDDDIPVIAALLADGRLDAVRCLSRLHSDAARDAILGALRKGHGDFQLARALQPYARDAATQAAVLAWLRDFGAHANGAGEFAKIVAVAGGEDALAVLRKLYPVCADGASADVAAAIAGLGGKDGIEALVRIAESYALGASEAARALNGISGRRVFSSNQRGDVGRTGNLDEASAWFRTWWEESKDKLTFDAAGRCWTTGEKARDLGLGKSPPEVAKRVEEILARADARNGFVVGGGDADDLAALGRDAIPALVERIRESPPWDDDTGHSCNAAAEALALLRTDADVPLLTTLVREGRLAAVASLRGCRDARAREALLSVVARGLDDFILKLTLDTMPVDAATWEALRAWLRAPGTRSGVWTAQYIEENATPEAVPVLREFLASKAIGPVMRVRCAAALARNGGRDGIEALIAIVESGATGEADESGWSEKPRDLAALGLNGIAGRRIFVEANDVFAGTDHTDAAKRFRAWWKEAGADLRFDAARRAWVTGDAAPTALPSAPAELRERVGKILDDARAATIWVSTSDGHLGSHARDLVALGRDAIPELVAAIRRGSAWGDAHERRDSEVAGQALAELAGAADRELILDLLAEGRLGVAPWLAKHRSREARDAAIDLVSRGWLSEAIESLEAFKNDDRVHETLAAWAQTYGATDEVPVASLCEILGTPSPATNAPVPADLLDRPIPSHTRWRIAEQLAKHGVKPGLAALVTTFEKPEALVGGDAVLVGTAINELAGSALVEIAKGERRHPDVGPGRLPRVMHFGEPPGVVKEPAEAAKRVRAWWEANAERLAFDAATGSWKAE